jgi:hypothetical protein
MDANPARFTRWRPAREAERERYSVVQVRWHLTMQTKSSELAGLTGREAEESQVSLVPPSTLQNYASSEQTRAPWRRASISGLTARPHCQLRGKQGDTSDISCGLLHRDISGTTAMVTIIAILRSECPS